MIRRLRSLITLPFRNLFVTLGIFLALVGFTVWKIIAVNHERRARVDPPVAEKKVAPPAPGRSAQSEPDSGAVSSDTKRDHITQSGSPLVRLVLPDEPEPTKTEPVIPKRIREQMLTPPAPISIGSYKPTKKTAPLPSAPVYYLPTGRRIPCMLVNALETGSTEIPIIGIVLEDQYNIDKDGVSRLVIPAGVEIHGTGSQSPMRDRVIGTGKWTFVWRTRDRHNAQEISVQALALNRDFDKRTGIYGASDGSPGLLGEKLQVDDEAQVKSLALRFLAATTRALQSQRETLNPLTNSIVATPKATIGNALAEGAAATMQGVGDQVDKMRETIMRDGFYVAVLPGKEFYLYTKEPFDLSKATGPGVSPVPSSAPLAATQP